jgi:DNA invertase Pin-like site-specific DNA recombinase
VRSALEWAQVRALAADGISHREIACRLGINRRTVARLLARDEPRRYRRLQRIKLPTDRRPGEEGVSVSPSSRQRRAF